MPNSPQNNPAKRKSALRKALRALRQSHVDALPEAMRGLVFHRPPTGLHAHIPDDAVLGFYSAAGSEAPTTAYASFFLERGHAIALPRFADKQSPMHFAEHSDPFEHSDCVPSPFSSDKHPIMQPRSTAKAITPDVVFVPLIGFCDTGERLGQGGGHYDRWLAANPSALAIGMGWDCQLVESLPTEAHDRAMDLIVTPTRSYGPF